MQKKDKTKFSLIKIICICLILMLLSVSGVMAVTTKVNTVKIQLSNGYEMTVFTSKTNVKQILDDNNIILDDNEKSMPSLDEDISDNKTIKITDRSTQEIEIAKVQESGIEITLDTLLEAYNAKCEKIEVVEEAIPYETITKDISEGSLNTKNRVLRDGVEGLKRVTYKVKYQNDVEIERNKISEEIIKEPIDKIIQISSKVVSSRSSATERGSSTTTATDISASVYKVTAYCPCSKCCSYANGITSCGRTAVAGRTIAAPSNFAFGTKVLINDHEYVVEDRGGAIKGNRIDIYVNTHSEALAWGVRYLPIQIVE